MPEKTGENTFRILQGELFFTNQSEIVKGPIDGTATPSGVKGVLNIRLSNGNEHKVEASDIDTFLEDNVHEEFDHNSPQSKEEDSGQDNLPWLQE